jgi:Uma2 family endonuclease
MAQAAADLRIAPLTVEQVHAMLENGILRDGDAIELIGGMLVYKDRSARGEDPMTIGKNHALAVKQVARLDREVERHGCHMQTQQPVTIAPYDEPEPDGAIVRGSIEEYRSRLPSAADVECVIEVADSSIEQDRGRKRALYARAGIPQYVIVNLCDDCIEVYEKPGEGQYTEASMRRRGERVELRVGAAARVAIDSAAILA